MYFIEKAYVFHRKSLYFIDFNPRFGGGYPFTHMSGYNFIRAVFDLMSKKKPNFLKKPKLIKATKGISMHLLDDNKKKESIIINSDKITFIITDFKNEINVTYSGLIPNLFSEEKGVVAEGFLEDRKFFIAEKILAKHDENYMPPEVIEAMGDK